MNLLKAKPLIEDQTPQLRQRVDQLKKRGHTPSLKVILVGDNPASMVYVNNKKKYALELGIDAQIVALNSDISSEKFLATVSDLNLDPSVHGLIIQLPLPDHLSAIDLDFLIDEVKDVDGFHPVNQYRVMKYGQKSGYPYACTPKGIMKLLSFNNIELAGKNAVVIGRSLIVGRPLANLLVAHNATVTLCHSHTKNLKEYTRGADIIIVAIGVANFLTTEHIDGDKNPIVIDVGINRDDGGKLCGDVDFARVGPLCGSITPVPGGVGPLTIFSLMENLVDATEKQVEMTASDRT